MIGRLFVAFVVAASPVLAQKAWEEEPHSPVPPMLDAQPLPPPGVYRFPGLNVVASAQMERDGAKVLRLQLSGVTDAPPYLDLRCGERCAELERFFAELKDARINVIVHVELDPPGQLPRSCTLEPAHVTDLLDVYHARRPFGFSEDRVFEYADWEGKLYARDASRVSLLLRTFWCDKGLLMCRSIGPHYDSPYFRDTFIRFGAILSAPDSKDGRYLAAVHDLYKIGIVTAHGKEGGPEIRFYRNRKLVGAHRTYPSKEQNDIADGWGVRVSYAEAQARYTMWKGTPERPYSTLDKDFDLYIAYFIANGVIDHYLERLAKTPMPDDARQDVLESVDRIRRAHETSEEWQRTFVALGGGDPTAPLPSRPAARSIPWLLGGGGGIVACILIAAFLRRRRAQ